MYYDITPEQHEVLLRPLNGTRVAKRKQAGQTLSYLEAWDVKAHLIRIFGFGGWSWEVIEANLAFEDTVLSKSGSENWNVGYKVVGRLRVAGATYTEAAVGSATLPSRGDAHDMAVKTAESDALKRAAINLGDQFGLGLYNNGQLVPVVKQTLYGPETAAHQRETLKASVDDLDVVPVTAEEAVDGTDEAAAPETPAETPEALTDSEGAAEWADKFRTLMNDGDVAGVVALATDMKAAGLEHAIYNGKTLAKIADLAVVHAGKVSAGREALGGEEVAADA